MKESLKIISRLLSDDDITTEEFVVLYDAMNKVAEYIPYYGNPNDNTYSSTVPYNPNYPYYITYNITCDS